MKTWFITGASRGLGLETARAALDAGNRVVATARDPVRITAALSGYGDRLLALALDVTDPEAVRVAVQRMKIDFGRVDVLINNAGYGQLGAFEEVPREALARQFDTNVFGVFEITRAILPIMREQRSGHIITVASVAGVEGYDGSSVYCASKFAVSGWSECLGLELARFGIKVTCVYPGRFRTDFLDGSSVRHGQDAISDYAASSAQKREALNVANHLQSGDPVRFARAVLELTAIDTPPARFAAGSDAYDIFLRRAEVFRRDAEAWRALTTSTDIVDRAWVAQSHCGGQHEEGDEVGR